MRDLCDAVVEGEDRAKVAHALLVLAKSQDVRRRLAMAETRVIVNVLL